MEKLRLGISACLLGEKVRYDGDHALDPFLASTLARYVEYVPVCPERELGLGVPREPMRLEGAPAAPRLVTIRTRRDLTEEMLAWARARVDALAAEGLAGFVFKARSPSCGVARVKLFDESGVPTPAATGLFARAFVERFPMLPAVEAEQLADPAFEARFVEELGLRTRVRASG